MYMYILCIYGCIHSPNSGLFISTFFHSPIFAFFHSPIFRFCVSVQRENFPVTPSPLPAHTLTILPPLTITNLLPCDLQVYLAPSSLCKMVRRGKEMSVYFVSHTHSRTHTRTHTHTHTHTYTHTHTHTLTHSTHNRALGKCVCVCVREIL